MLVYQRVIPSFSQPWPGTPSCLAQSSGRSTAAVPKARANRASCFSSAVGGRNLAAKETKFRGPVGCRGQYQEMHLAYSVYVCFQVHTKAQLETSGTLPAPSKRWHLPKRQEGFQHLTAKECQGTSKSQKSQPPPIPTPKKQNPKWAKDRNTSKAEKLVPSFPSLPKDNFYPGPPQVAQPRLRCGHLGFIFGPQQLPFQQGRPGTLAASLTPEALGSQNLGGGRRFQVIFRGKTIGKA